MKFDPNTCRSLLFVPAGNDRYLESALRGNADVIQIDLEDSIPPNQKEQAREDARRSIDRIHDNGRVGTVRINTDPSFLLSDLNEVVRPGLAGLTIPKVSSAESLKQIDEAVTLLEEDRQMPVGTIRFIVLIESATGVLNARQIASATPRLAAMGIGMEDLAADIGSSVNPDTLYFPSMLVLYAAREADVTPIGYLGSITIYNDPGLFGQWIRRAKSLGFEGGFCIHPNQVDILNAEFAPTEREAEEARLLINAFETSSNESSGVFSYQGRMVDKPVIDRARRTLMRHDRFS